MLTRMTTYLRECEGEPGGRRAPSSDLPVAPARAATGTGSRAGVAVRTASRQGRLRDRAGRKSDWKRPADKQVPRTADQATYDGPPMPEDITGGSSTGR